MKRYEIKLADQDENDDLRISLVKDPAVESNLMKFSKEIKTHHFSDHEKKIVFSAAMIPNKLIFRKDVYGEPAEVFYTPETVEKFRNQYFTSKRSSNLYHMDSDIDGVDVVESWIVNDPETDKSKSMGFTGITKGTWMVGMKINNEEVWTDHIKTGKIDGFSIEGSFSHELSKDNYLKTNTKMKKEISRALFAAIKKVAMESELKEYVDGDFKFYALDLEVGTIVTDADGNPIPNAEFKYEDKEFKTGDLGEILEAEVKDEEVKEDVIVEMKGSDKKVKMEEVVIDETVELAPADAEELARLREEVALLRSERDALIERVAEIEAEKAVSETQLVAMAKMTMGAKPIKLTPTKMSSQDFSKLTPREKFELERSFKK